MSRIKRIIAIFFFSITLASIIVFPACSSDLKPIQLSIEEESFGKNILDSLCSKTFRGRRAGTVGNQLAFEYIKQLICEMGYVPETQEFRTAKGTVLHNLIVTIPGDSDSTVVVGAHYDGAVESNNVRHYQAAEDNGSGTTTLLIMLNVFKNQAIKSNRTIVCCFWDGEEYLEGQTFRGSSHFVQNIPESMAGLILLYLNLDTIGHDHYGDNEIYMEYLGNKRVEEASNTMSSNGRFVYHVSECSFFNSDYTPFYRAGIPIINFHDHMTHSCSHPNHTAYDTKEAISIVRLYKIAYNVLECIDYY